MALTVTPKTGTTSSGTSQVSPTFSTAANSVLVAVVSGAASTGLTTPLGLSGGGLTWVRLGGFTESETRMDLFYALTGAGTASMTVTYTAGSSQSRLTCHVVQVSGTVDLTNPIGLYRIADVAHDGAVNVDFDPTGAATAVQNGAALIAAFAGSQVGGPSSSPGSGWTEAYDQTPGSDWGHQQTQYRVTTSAGITQASWTDVSTSTDNFGSIAVMVEVRASDGGDGYTLAPGSVPTLFGTGAGISGTGAVQPLLPASILADDIIIAVYETANEAVPATTGYADVRTPSGTGTAAGTTATRLTMRWKKAVGGDSPPPAVDGGDHTIARTFVFRGCDPVNPIGASNSNTATSSTAVSMPSLVSERNNSLIFGGVSNATDTATNQISSWTNAGLASLTDQGGHQAIDGNGGGFDLFTGQKATAGAVGTTTATLATASVKSTMHLVLQPPWVKTFVAGAGGDVTGTLVSTESGVDVAAGTGAVEIAGTLARTESGVDVAALSGQVIVAGTLVVTETGVDGATIAGSVGVGGTLAATETGADIASITGSTPIVITGTLAVTEPSDTASITGQVTVTGALAGQEAANDVSAITGLVTVAGSLAAQEIGSDVAAILGAISIQGSLAATEVKDIASIAAAIGITGTLAAQETGADTSSTTGAVGVTGTLATTEQPDVSNITGLVTVSGSLAAVEQGTDTVFIAGGVGPPGISGGLGATETAVDISAISGVVVIAGSLSAIEGGTDSLAAAAAVIVSGSLAGVESSPDVAQATGSVSISGALTATETRDVVSILGSVTGAGVAGTLAATETASDLLSAAVVIQVAGGLVGQETGIDVAAATGTVGPPAITGTLTTVEAGSDVVSASGQVSVAGSLAVMEAPDVVSIGLFIEGATDNLTNLRASIDDISVLKGSIVDLVALNADIDDIITLRGHVDDAPILLRGSISETIVLRGDLNLKVTA